MKKQSKTKSNKVIFLITAVILVIAVICGAVIPVLRNTQIQNHMYADGSKAENFNVEAFDVSFGDKSEFLFNSKNASFAVYSEGIQNLFFSHGKSAADSDNATFLNIRLRDKKGNSYTMNTASNSVAFNSFEVVEKKKNSISLEFDFFPDKESADVGIGNCSVYASIPLDISFENNNLRVSVDTRKVVLPKGFLLEKLSILPGLYSVEEGDNGVSYVVPDGCGAVIDVGAVTQKALTLNMGMYGEDVSFYDYSEGAVLPFFAIINSQGFGINTIINEGDALSQITCKKYKDGGGYLYNTFTVTACGVVNERFEFGEMYEGVISQSYTVDENEMDYNTIAAQLRDNLVARGYISSTLNGNYTDLPFFINVVGSSDGENQLTTYEDATEITALLKSRGVRNIALRFSGYNSKGLCSPAGDIRLSKELGSKEDFNTLCEEISEQGNGLYLDANILISDKASGKKVTIYGEESKFVGAKPAEFTLSKISSINNNISEAYTFISQYGIAGTCINDASNVLYTDLKGHTDRQSFMCNLKDNTNSLSACGNLMLDYPAIYLTRNADAVFTTPYEASCSNYSCVTSVPVLQMVLHGSVVYGSQPINVSNLSYEDSILKCIEYGCVPSFLFTHDETGISYNAYATQTAKMYSKAKQLLPVMNMRITSHERVTEGVYKITYDYSKVFYVNYNPSLVEINGIMISAKDFVAI